MCTLGPLGALLGLWVGGSLRVHAGKALGAQHLEAPGNTTTRNQTNLAADQALPPLAQPAAPRQRSLCEMKERLTGSEEVGTCN